MIIEIIIRIALIIFCIIPLIFIFHMIRLSIFLMIRLSIYWIKIYNFTLFDRFFMNSLLMIMRNDDFRFREMFDINNRRAIELIIILLLFLISECDSVVSYRNIGLIGITGDMLMRWFWIFMLCIIDIFIIYKLLLLWLYMLLMLLLVL